MGMREKLIELIGRVQDEGIDYSDVVCVYKTSNGRLADYLIANGVTIPVRCKDCEYRADLLDNGNYLCNRKMLGMVRPNDFCSFGERRTDE